MDINKSQKKRAQVFYFFKFLRPYWKLCALTIVLSQSIVYLGLINPFFAKLVIDNAYVNKDLRYFLILTAVGASVFIFSGILSSLNDYISGYLRQKVALDINKETISSLHSLDLAFLKDSSSGEHLYKIHYDTERVVILITDTFLRALWLIPTFLLTFIIILFLKWQMALTVFFLGALFYFHAAFFTKRRLAITQKLIMQRQGIFRRMNEVFQKMYMLKAVGMNEYERHRHLNRLHEAMEIFFKNLKLQIASKFSSQLLSRSIMGGLAFYGGYQIIRGDMSLGTLTAILVYLNRISDFHSKASNLVQNINIGSISCERVKGILDKAGKESTDTEKKRPVSFQPHIEFINVDFYYHPSSYILKDFSIDISSKQWVGLVGPSGCGKTTIMNLLLGLYWPGKGEVLMGGISTKEIDLNFIREDIGIALQEPYLWNETIKENLLYFNRSASQTDIEQVISQIRLEDAVKSQPKGIDTNLGDSACKFSEGQKQRLALARALIKKPKLLIMDEALSFVDNETSTLILRDIKMNYTDMGTLIITHNPNLLEFADNVIYMKSPGVVIEGSHADLRLRDDYSVLFNPTQKAVQNV
ncbi:ABC transporter ATP-binding protein [Candidatus Omnitrophota bacterium]